MFQNVLKEEAKEEKVEVIDCLTAYQMVLKANAEVCQTGAPITNHAKVGGFTFHRQLPYFN